MRKINGVEYKTAIKCIDAKLYKSSPYFTFMSMDRIIFALVFRLPYFLTSSFNVMFVIIHFFRLNYWKYQVIFPETLLGKIDRPLKVKNVFFCWDKPATAFRNCCNSCKSGVPGTWIIGSHNEIYQNILLEEDVIRKKFPLLSRFENYNTYISSRL